MSSNSVLFKGILNANKDLAKEMQNGVSKTWQLTAPREKLCIVETFTSETSSIFNKQQSKSILKLSSPRL